MRRLSLAHPCSKSLLAGVATFGGLFVILGALPGQEEHIVIVNSSADAPLRSAAEIALAATPSDKSVAEWLRGWGLVSHSGESENLGRDEQQAAGLLKLLGKTNLPGSDLLQIAQALYGDGNSSDKPLASWFFRAAMDRTQKDLALLQPSDTRAGPLVALLWESENFEGGGSEWQTRQAIYSTLIRWEPAGSAKQYRARLKHAEVLVLCYQPTLALNEMAAFVKDVNNGAYPSPNEKDIAEVYWFAYQRAGLYAEGLKYLTELIGKFKGTSDEQRLKAIWIYALAESGNTAEAEAQYAGWMRSNAGTASRTAIDHLTRLLRQGEQMPHIQPPTTSPYR